MCLAPHCEVQGTRSQIWAGNWAQNPVPKIRPSSGPAGWDKVCASGVIRLLSKAKPRVTVCELEAVPGETVRPSLLGDISAAVLWLVVSVCSDFCTVLWHVIRFESTYYLCGLELAVSGCFRHFLCCGYRRRTKRGGSYGLAPPLCIGSRGGSSGQTASICFATFSGTCESIAC